MQQQKFKVKLCQFPSAATYQMACLVAKKWPRTQEEQAIHAHLVVTEPWILGILMIGSGSSGQGMAGRVPMPNACHQRLVVSERKRLRFVSQNILGNYKSDRKKPKLYIFCRKEGLGKIHIKE